MNKAELIAAIAEKSGMSKKDADKMMSAAVEAITAALKEDDKVSISNLGIFEVRTRAARTGRNPRTGEAIEIAESKVPSFKASKVLKDAVAE